MYNFNVFLYKIYDLRTMGAELGQYFVQNHTFKKNSEDSVGV